MAEEENRQGRIDAELVASTNQRTVQDLKPAPQLSNEEIVVEARGLHEQFWRLADEYNGAPAARRAELREEMWPVVNRERDLRQEYAGRTKRELAHDQALDQEISFSR